MQQQQHEMTDNKQQVTFSPSVCLSPFQITSFCPSSTGAWLADTSEHTRALGSHTHTRTHIFRCCLTHLHSHVHTQSRPASCWGVILIEILEGDLCPAWMCQSRLSAACTESANTLCKQDTHEHTHTHTHTYMHYCWSGSISLPIPVFYWTVNGFFMLISLPKARVPFLLL